MRPGGRFAGGGLDRPAEALFARRTLRALAIAGSLIAVPQIALAGDEIRVSADVSPTVGYSTNPFSGTGSGLGSAYVEIAVRPQVRVIAQHSVLTIDGNVSYQHYFKRYANSNDYGAAADYSRQVTARLATHAAVSYDSSIVGGFDILNPVLTPVIDPTLPPVPVTVGTDVGLFGTRARRKLLAFSGDASYALSDRESLSVNGFYNRSRYGGLAAGQSSFDGYGGGAGYSRRMSDRLQLGAQASIARTVYQGLFGTSQVYSLQATFNDKLNSRWTLGGALGASYSQRTIGGNTLSPTGNLQLCRLGPRSSLCATASESVQPTGYTGTVVSQSAGLSYSYKLSEHSGLGVTGTYSHNNNPAIGGRGNAIGAASAYFTAAGTYTRTLRERLSFVVTTQYRSISGGPGNRPSDVSGSVGFLVRLGDYK